MKEDHQTTEKQPPSELHVYVKRVLGGALSIGSLAFIVYGIFTKGVVWNIPKPITIILLLTFLYLLFLLEGTLIAVVQLKDRDYIPPEIVQTIPQIKILLKMQEQEQNVAMFLIGRQILVSGTVYMIAGLTEFSEPILSIAFTILAGIFTVVCFGQLIPQLMAEKTPTLFFSILGVREIITLCIFISKIGIGHFSHWVAAKWIQCMQRNELDGVDGDIMSNHDNTLAPSEIDLVKDINHNNNDFILKLTTAIYSQLNLDIPTITKSSDAILAVSLGLHHEQTKNQAVELLSLLKENDVHTEVVDYLQKTDSNAQTDI